MLAPPWSCLDGTRVRIDFYRQAAGFPDTIRQFRSICGVLLPRGDVVGAFYIAKQGPFFYSPSMEQRTPQIRMIAQNRRARRDFEILSTVEAGIELRGSEVKSLREGKVNLADAYAVIEGGQVVLRNLHIPKYKMATHDTLDPDRPRRLLLHRQEIRKLTARTVQRGMTLIPLALYFKGKRAKVELGLAVGRKKYDKRDAIAKAEADRRIKQALKKDLR